MKNYGNQKGSITVEAAMALPLFMFAFFALLLLATTVRAQSNIQYALDQTAKEISQYYYVAEKLGLNEDYTPDSSALDEVNAFKENMGAFSDATTGMVDAAGNVPSTANGDLKGLLESVDNVEKAYNQFVATGSDITEYFKNPQDIIASFGTIAESSIKTDLMSKVVVPILVKTLMPKYVTNEGDISKTLESMGVVNGFDGMDFQLSRLAQDGEDIHLIATYQIKPLGFGLIDYEFNIMTSASTRVWGTSK